MPRASCSAAGTLEVASLQVCIICVLVSDECAPVLGVKTLDVLTLFEVCLQIHGEEQDAASVVGALHGSVVTTALMLLPGAELDGEGAPTGSTSNTGGFPAPITRQPCLQWMKSSLSCLATAMLFTTTVSLAWSTGHFSVGGGQADPVARPAPRPPVPLSSLAGQRRKPPGVPDSRSGCSPEAPT